MRRVLTTLAACAALTATACGGGAGDEDTTGAAAAAAAKPDAFFGWVLGTSTPTGIAIDADPPADGGVRRVRVYVCDGLGPPRGKAIWFSGTVDVDRVNRVRRGVTLRSVSGHERLYLEHFDEHVVSGAFVDRRGRRRQFAAGPSTGGAGIYQVTLDERLRYTGTSTQGHRLSAQARRDGAVRGEIVLAGGESIAFRINTLSLAPVAELRRNGFSRTHRRDRARSLRPGEYVAVVAPGGSHWLGRSGNVRGGSSGANIIGLDKAC